MVQQTWRATASDRRRWRQIRRIATSILLAALVVYLIVLLTVPFLHPKTHLFLLAASSSQPLTGPQLDYVENDLEALGRVGDNLSSRGSVRVWKRLDNLRSREKMRGLDADLQSHLSRPSDILVLYTCSAPVMLGETPQLLCSNFQPTFADIGEAAYPVEALLDQVRACKASVKLLLMDIGRSDYDARLGSLPSPFPDRLRSMVEETRDPSLWVLTSNRWLERSHVARSLERSVFAYFLGHGLEGAADTSGDGYVSVDELHRYVANNVHALVQTQTEGLACQTPELLWGGGSLSNATSYPRLLAVGRQPRESEPERLARSIAMAGEASRIASYYDLVRTPTAEEVAYRATAGLRPGGRLGQATDRLFGSTISGLRRASVNPGAKPDSGTAATSSTDEAAVAGSGPSADASEKSVAPGAEDASGGRAAASGAKTSAKPDQAESVATGGPDLESERRRRRDRMAQLLAEAWRLRDALRDRSETTVIPFDYAPHLWRQLEQRLWAYDRQFRAGDCEAAEYVDRLAELVDSLREFLAGKVLIPGSSDPLVLRIATAKMATRTAADGVLSLGLAEFLAGQQGVALPKELQARIEALDAFADQGDQAEFQQWVEKSLPAEYERFLEFWLARRLVREVEIPWAEQQRAIRTRRVGERVAAAAHSCLPWVRDKIQAADRLRLAGERGLRDRVGEDWQQRTRTQLNSALQAYQEAAQDCRDVMTAQQRSNDVADRCRAYVRWRWAAGREPQTDVPSHEALARLLESLTSLCQLLENPAPGRLADVRLIDTQLAKFQEQVESGLADGAILRIVAAPGDPWKIESLLSTVLPSAAMRLQLLATAAKVETDRLATMTFPDLGGTPPGGPSLQRGDWQRVLELSRLEHALARLAVSRFREDRDIDSSLNYPPFLELEAALLKLEQLATSSHRTAYELAEMLPEVGAAARSFYRGLPDWISGLTENVGDLRDLQRRESALRKLRVAVRGMQHVHPRDALRLEAVDVAGTLARSALFDQLVWQRERAFSARDDAAADEATSLTEVAQVYAQLAASIPGQPHLPADRLPQIRLDSPTSVSLASVSEAPLELAIQNLQPRSVHLWVVLDYDPLYLEVDAAAKNPVYPPRGSASAGLRDYPFPADLQQEPKTFELSGGARAALALTVRRRATPTRPVKLICKVLAVDPQDGSAAFLRHQVDVGIPTGGMFELEIAGTPGSWTRSDERVDLHAFANRSTAFQLQLRNLTSAAQQLDVQLFGSDLIATPPLPAGALPAEAAAKLLEGFAPATVLIPSFPVTLAAGSDALGIPFPSPGKESPAASGKADGETKPPTAPAANEPATPDSKTVTANEKSAQQPLPRNLVFVLTDRQTGRQTLRHIALTVQRPHRFLRPRVSYDSQRERIELRLGPVAPGLLPPGKTLVHAELGGDLPAGLGVKLDAELSPENPETVVYAPIPAAPARIVSMHLSVDDYPRAFVYQVPCWASAADIPERTDLTEVRLTGLPDGDVYKAPAGNIPVRFEVDAPRVAFEGGEDVLYVGYDLDRDRELKDEPRIAIHADRQVELFLDGFAPDGRLTIRSRVGDFQQTLPAVPLPSGRLGVLAELSVAGRVAWSNTVEITVDGRKPRVYQSRIRPGPELAPGAEAELSVLATDDDLSGIAKVEAAIDVDGTNEFGAANKPLAAIQDPESGAWVVKLPTKDLAAGVHRVLVRAIDRVDNVGEVTTLNLQIMSAAAAESAGLNRVSGRVIYGQGPVADAEVKLAAVKGEPKLTSGVSEQGVFEFSKVPPGKYVLQARSLVHNKYRTAEVEFEVAAPPAQVELQELRLK